MRRVGRALDVPRLANFLQAFKYTVFVYIGMPRFQTFQ